MYVSRNRINKNVSTKDPKHFHSRSDHFPNRRLLHFCDSTYRNLSLVMFEFLYTQLVFAYLPIRVSVRRNFDEPTRPFVGIFTNETLKTLTVPPRGRGDAWRQRITDRPLTNNKRNSEKPCTTGAKGKYSM